MSTHDASASPTGAGVLIAVHGGPTSVKTIQIGAALADRWRVEPTVLTVVTPALESVRRSAVERRIGDAVGDRKLPLVVKNGALGPTIAQTAESTGAALVVIGLGRGSHRTAAAIVRWARRSVLAVAPRESQIMTRVILTADFGGSNVRADECALSLLEADAHADLVHVIPDLVHLSPEKKAVWRRIYDNVATELLDYTRNRLPRRAGHTIPTRVFVGDAANVLVDIAHQEQADLIALGRHILPATPSDDDCLGPVLESVLESAPCSVLVAP
ncbi:MAG TPA: universal stress protein [Gemmatimonadaceae bacterium]|nr:universal stress protein [Gemmatimonadaceae bacterium]